MMFCHDSTEQVQEFGEVKNCVASCNKEGLMKHLEKQQKELEICEKALAEYMESKRRAFPRFYFVSSADLLDILSNGNNPIKVMQHMNKCFQVYTMSAASFCMSESHCSSAGICFACIDTLRLTIYRQTIL